MLRGACVNMVRFLMAGVGVKACVKASLVLKLENERI